MLGIQHIVVIARGRPWTHAELDVLVSAAAQLMPLEPATEVARLGS